MSNQFPSTERLKSRKLISALFADRQSIGEYPFRFFWKKVDDLEVPIQVAFTVPKRKFKRAVHRNRIRRRMKEVYRLGLGHRYGRIMQAISGIHFNYSLPETLWDQARERAPSGGAYGRDRWQSTL